MSLSPFNNPPKLAHLLEMVKFPRLPSGKHELYFKQLREKTVLSLLVIMPVTCLLHLILMPVEYKIYPKWIFILITYHISIIAGCGTMFFLVYKRRLLDYVVSIASLLWIASALSVAMPVALIENGMMLYGVGVIFTIFYACIFIRLPFFRAAALCFLIFPIITFALYASGSDYVSVIYGIDIMLYASIIGLSSSYIIERLERDNFVLHDRFQREKAISDEYTNWLRQLATFLRHEVRQPIAQINSSVELCAIKSQGDPNLTSHLLDATSAAQHVWHLIERASRATDAEAFVRTGRPERVELRHLLGPLVQGFMQTHSGVRFELNAPGTSEVQADPVLLKEAVSNLLSNAASFADEDTAVEVTLAARDGKAEIKVRNEGPHIEGDSESLFQAFASSRSGASSSHHGLGLYLVRLIAQQHGGRATISNSADGKGVEASLLLPLTG